MNAAHLLVEESRRKDCIRMKKERVSATKKDFKIRTKLMPSWKRFSIMEATLLIPTPTVLQAFWTRK